MVAVKLRVIDYTQAAVETEVRLYVYGRAQHDRIPFRDLERLSRWETA